MHVTYSLVVNIQIFPAYILLLAQWPVPLCKYKHSDGCSTFSKSVWHFSLVLFCLLVIQRAWQDKDQITHFQKCEIHRQVFECNTEQLILIYIYI